MKVIIAGSRSITDQRVINDAVAKAAESDIIPSEVFSGGARGVDLLGERWARQHKIPVRRFIPFWHLYGKSAGMKRNVEMATHADALIAVWDGESRGTKHMIHEASKRGLKIFVLKHSHYRRNQGVSFPEPVRTISPAGDGRSAFRGPEDNNGSRNDKYTEPRLCPLTGAGAALK